MERTCKYSRLTKGGVDLDRRTPEENEEIVIKKEDVLRRVDNEYEAIVVIAKEARRLNSAPGLFLEEGEKAVDKAAMNFVEGKIDYVVEEEAPKKRSRSSKKI